MNPSGRSMFARWSSPVTGFLKVSPRPSPIPSILNVLLTPLPSIVILAFSNPTTLKVGPRSSQGIPPSDPVKIWPSAWTCASVVDGSTTKAHCPFPSWMALGQSTTAAHFTPDRSTSPQEPLVMWRPTSARQLPSFELGIPPKLQPQPKSQLQYS